MDTLLIYQLRLWDVSAFGGRSWNLFGSETSKVYPRICIFDKKKTVPKESHHN
ncbi:MAG: hypothetical protein QG640_352 [Patescibacteria group bacterium]|nr:hypothetical protein [Patescibacteria group bacterium]MDQ5976400.1 hypothetical protein [Patescibacteria group bacterium]